MKKLTAGLAVAAMALTHSLAVAAQPVAALDRAGSPVAEAEDIGGAGGWAVLLAIAVGLGVIVLIESEEDDLPVSP